MSLLHSLRVRRASAPPYQLPYQYQRSDVARVRFGTLNRRPRQSGTWREGPHRKKLNLTCRSGALGPTRQPLQRKDGA
jgi:hypothetical protein